MRQGSDPHFKYHMFKRLNTGGEKLSEQQVRNSTIRMLSAEFPDFIIAMSKVVEFVGCTEYLMQERFDSAFNEELVLRFFALKNRRDRFRHGVSDFLSDYMEDIADPAKAEAFDYGIEEAVFRKTFMLLQRALGAYSFAFAKKDKSGLAGGFSTYHYESITIGLQEVIDKIHPEDSAMIRRLGEVLRNIKLDAGFVEITSGGGKNSPGLLGQRIGFVADKINNEFP